MRLERAAISSSAPSVAPPLVHEVLRSPGQPLDRDTRFFMESRFGNDFSGVRVHTDAKAAESARSVNALAYTVGPHLVFGNGHYSPASPGGRKLLAHELTHSVQQAGRGVPSLQTKLEVSRPGDAAEREAGAIAEEAVAGRPIRVEERTPSIVHRLSKETWGNISLGLGITSAALGVLGLATGHGEAGGIGLGIGAAGIITGLALRHKKLPPPTSIRVAGIHQFPLNEDSVSGGIKSGLGGVVELEVSNGNVDYDGSGIDEHFVRGDCSNPHGVGGRRGSGFTVGYGFTDRTFPQKIHLPPKHNVFYDEHLFASKANDSPPRPCAQQYLFGGKPIEGKTFVRRYDAFTTNIAGETVTVCTVDVSEQGPGSAAVQPGANATGQTGANASSAAQPNAPPATQPPAAGTPAS